MHGAVGVDVGWRMTEGHLRVAYWVGSDGREGELRLASDWLAQWKKTENIRSIRDRLFNAARDATATWLNAITPPEWMEDAAKTITQWRAQARLAALALRWRENRIAGDDAAFSTVEKWRRRDKHLYEYEANLRDQLLRRREDLYRTFAAEMRRMYKTAMVEALDLRDFHELPKAEGADVDGALREHARDACLSFLLRCLRESVPLTCAVPAPNTTRRHADCGHVFDLDRSLIMVSCPSCGAVFDQDRNAAINLLRTPIRALE